MEFTKKSDQEKQQGIQLSLTFRRDHLRMKSKITQPSSFRCRMLRVSDSLDTFKTIIGRIARHPRGIPAAAGERLGFFSIHRSRCCPSEAGGTAAACVSVPALAVLVGEQPPQEAAEYSLDT